MPDGLATRSPFPGSHILTPLFPVPLPLYTPWTTSTLSSLTQDQTHRHPLDGRDLLHGHRWRASRRTGATCEQPDPGAAWKNPTIVRSLVEKEFLPLGRRVCVSLSIHEFESECFLFLFRDSRLGGDNVWW